MSEPRTCPKCHGEVFADGWCSSTCEQFVLPPTALTKGPAS